jgi:DNA-binding transcriptional MerR regulator
MANPQPVSLATEPTGGKSPEAFRTISEVAAELDLPQHVLRFWETRFAAIKPLKRSGGRRYYRPEDVALLRRIRDLLREKGYTIKGVQKLLRQGGERLTAVGGAETPVALDPFAGTEAADAIVPNPRLSDSDDAGDEAVSFSPVARGELEAILADLEALRAFIKAR